LESLKDPHISLLEGINDLCIVLGGNCWTQHILEQGLYGFGGSEVHVMQLLDQETKLGILLEGLPLHPVFLLLAHILAEHIVLFKPVKVRLVSFVTTFIVTYFMTISHFVFPLCESPDLLCFITQAFLVVAFIKTDSVDLEATTDGTKVNGE
jgi:hypothetical protein